MHRTTRPRRPAPAPLLARLLPALLCALCAFLMTPAPALAAGTPAIPAATASPVTGPASGDPGAPTRTASAAEVPVPVPGTPAAGPVRASATAPEAGPAPGGPAPVTAAEGAVVLGSVPQAGAAEAAELPAVVEHSVRFPAPPVAPPVLRSAADAPARGRVAGDPRRERAPPHVPYDPRTPRGPPSTRHS
ncbi:hypothetical protein ACIQRS_22060 [Streptomyces termitum]|uniref:Uncharacterized protein n=1 Tax=Streptomyces termitum TaxID=67368 RepID=A0A918T6Y7_9ACTN|nr:hypothetical protein [Streptomyces termitum]GHA92708.1 hypothetical protein GCM10010305_40530 [Streptomyces termitum]